MLRNLELAYGDEGKRRRGDFGNPPPMPRRAGKHSRKRGRPGAPHNHQEARLLQEIKFASEKHRAKLGKMYPERVDNLYETRKKKGRSQKKSKRSDAEMQMEGNWNASNALGDLGIPEYDATADKYCKVSVVTVAALLLLPRCCRHRHPPHLPSPATLTSSRNTTVHQVKGVQGFALCRDA